MLLLDGSGGSLAVVCSEHIFGDNALNVSSVAGNEAVLCHVGRAANPVWRPGALGTVA